MLQIQVLGSGLIPRGFGIAPRKDLLRADLSLCQIILSTPGLYVKYLRPDNNKLYDLTNKNVAKVYEQYSGYTGPVKKVEAPKKEKVAQSVKEEKVEVKEEVKAEVKEEKVVVTEAAKQESNGEALKPVISPKQGDNQKKNKK